MLVTTVSTISVPGVVDGRDHGGRTSLFVLRYAVGISSLGG